METEQEINAVRSPTFPLIPPQPSGVAGPTALAHPVPLEGAANKEVRTCKASSPQAAHSPEAPSPMAAPLL